MKNLIQVFEDTKSISQQLPNKTLTHKFKFDDIIKVYEKSNGDNIIVENIDSVSAVVKYSKLGKSCVLNMASPKRPGGGVANGARAQEECLFRCSNLCDVITTEHYPLDKTECLYTPRSIFFKDSNYDIMDSIESDVMTIAAFNLSNEIVTDSYIEDTKNKIRLMCSIPSKSNVKNLILGAWGCGVFNNDPITISTLFKQVLIDEGYATLYNKVIFAIINDHNSVGNNYSIFKGMFNETIA
jgi:uncharacterized protein (TIGR02452 family)